MKYPIKIENESECYAEGININSIVEELRNQNYDLVAMGNHNSIEAISRIMDYNNNEIYKKNIVFIVFIVVSIFFRLGSINVIKIYYGLYRSVW